MCVKCTGSFTTVQSPLKKGTQAAAHCAGSVSRVKYPAGRATSVDEVQGLLSCFALFYLDLRSQFPIIQTSRPCTEPVLQGEEKEWVGEERRCEDHMAGEGKGERKRPEGERAFG